jgi:hypothetical protein
MTSPPELRVLGIRGLDRHEMQNLIPAADLAFEEPTAADRPGTSFEPATLIALLVLSGPVLKGLAAWILKKRNRKDVAVEVEKRQADGSYQRVAVTMHLSESSTEAEVVRALGQQLGIDHSLIAAVTGHSGSNT